MPNLTSHPAQPSVDDVFTQNGQDHKLASVNVPVDRRTTSPDRVVSPASSYVEQAGNVMPASLITGLRSDLHGQITAQVTENVYGSPIGVILSCGAFNTPQLLMLAGIGPSDRLKTLGVKTRVDLPAGQSLQDQPGSFFLGKTGPSEFRLLMRADRVARAMIVGYLLGTGPATMVPGVCAFVRSEASLPRPDIELIFRGSSLKPHIWFPGIRRPFEDAFAARPVLLRPKSRGEVLLRVR